MQIELTKIVIDPEIYPRSQVNPYQVHRLAEAIEAGEKLPPIILEAKTNRLVDGRHRMDAHERLKLASIEAKFKSYATPADIFADAVALNVTHGVPLSNYEVRSAVAKLEAMGFERDRIGTVVRMTSGRLDEMVKGFGQDSDGQSIALKGGLAHKAGKPLSDSQQAAMKHYAGGQATFYVRQIILLLANDLWPRDSDSFAAEMDKLAAMWKKAK
jgi:ParB-like nuclease domain